MFSGVGRPAAKRMVWTSAGPGRAGAWELVPAAGRCGRRPGRGLPGGEHGEQRRGDQRQRQAAGEQRQHHAVPGDRPVHPPGQAAPAPRPQLAVICLDILGEFPGIIGNLDVDRWQAVIVPPLVAASIHAHLSCTSGLIHLQYEPARRVSSLARPSLPGSGLRVPVPWSRRVARLINTRGIAKDTLSQLPPGQQRVPRLPSISFRSVNCLLDLHVCRQGRPLDSGRRGSIGIAEGVCAT